MQRLQQPQDAACVGEAGADRRVQVLDSRQSFQAGRIGDFQYLADAEARGATVDVPSSWPGWEPSWV